MKHFFKRMPGSLHVRKTVLIVLKLSKRILFSITRALCIMSKPQIFLAYDNEVKMDGIGAQVQRILAFRSLSHNLHLGYVHSGIKSVAVHPLDPYQTPEKLKAFLIKLNAIFFINNSFQGDFAPDRTIRIKELTFTKLLKNIFVSVLFRKSIMILSVEPYPVSEFDNRKFIDIADFLPNYPSRPVGKISISIHYRRGVGGFAVQVGELISREIESKYFLNLLEEIVSTLDKDNIEIAIFTDSPANDLSYVPPLDQHQLWENSPKFKSGVMEVKGMNLEEQFSGLGVPLSIIYGGDPLDALIQMSFSDYLVMSRSSFGYVAALMNKTGKVYYPKSFWHGPRPDWKVIDEPTYD